MSSSSSTTRVALLREPSSKVRTTLCFDLENRPLAYWYEGETTSEITAFGWKWSDESQVHTLLLQSDGTYENDEGFTLTKRETFRLFVDELTWAGVAYGHNIRRHDLPMLNAGLLRLQLPSLPRLLTSDTCRDLPKRGGLSYSLENLAAMYGLGGLKLTMTQPAWEEANRLTHRGITLARERVVADVLLQEELRAEQIRLGELKPPRVWSP